jgi:hypothetical protein
VEVVLSDVENFSEMNLTSFRQRSRNSLIIIGTNRGGKAQRHIRHEVIDKNTIQEIIRALKYSSPTMWIIAIRFALGKFISILSLKTSCRIVKGVQPKIWLRRILEHWDGALENLCQYHYQLKNVATF